MVPLYNLCLVHGSAVINRRQHASQRPPVNRVDSASLAGGYHPMVKTQLLVPCNNTTVYVVNQCNPPVKL